MRELKVFVTGYGTDAGLALPFEVYSPRGRLLGVGAASAMRPSEVLLPDLESGKREDGGNDDSDGDWGRVYVLAKLPNGTSIQSVANFHRGVGEVKLDQGRGSPHEWLQWVTPFRSLDHLLLDRSASRFDNETLRPSRRIGKVWATLWSFGSDGRWNAKEVDAVDRQRDEGMQQFTVDVPRVPHLLQIGGEEVAWRLVSLPPGGLVRVALTRSATEDGDAVDVTVGRRHPDNELIMSYLARGEISEADRIGESWKMAERMLQRKYDDPVTAAAGAYYLLKTNRLEERWDWLQNLVFDFPEIADGPIVAAALERQREGISEDSLRWLVTQAMNRGLPIFSLGAKLLVETMAAIHRGKDETRSFHRMYLAAQAYARAVCSKGPYMAFYGLSPAQPSWVPLYGLEGEPQATPLSQGGGKPVFLSRPRGSLSSGTYGRTTVSLPHAPVTGEMLGEIFGFEVQEVSRLSSNTLPSLPRRTLRNSYEGGLPVLRLTLPSGYLPLPAESAGQKPRTSASRSVDSNAAQEASYRRPEVKRPPAQTAAYWRDERMKHSISVFSDDD